jgi:hypothetical protein
MPIIRFARASFDPPAIQEMSKAFADVCAILQVPEGDKETREAIATRIIDFARGGIIDADKLRDRLLQEYQSAHSHQDRQQPDTAA